MSREAAPWSVRVRLSELARGPVERRLAPDAATRARIAASLDLLSLQAFEADVRLRPWLDGVEVEGRWRATVEQTCGLSLDPFETGLEGELHLTAVPAGSALAAQPCGDVVVELESEDPPEVLDADEIDLGAYLVESLALEIDPFPRKPGAEFEAPPAEVPPSPFAVLARLKRDADPEG